MVVMIENGSTHESAVAAAAQAGASMTLLVPDPIGQDRLLLRRYTRYWTDDDDRPVDVRIAPLRHIQKAVAVARAGGIHFEGVHLAGGRAVAFEPTPSFNATREVRRTKPLVLDLPRDPIAYYEQMLAAHEGQPCPVLSFSMRETKATAHAVGLAVNAALTARYHHDCRYEGRLAQIDLAHLDRWSDDGFRTEVTFTKANDSGVDLAIKIRANS